MACSRSAARGAHASAPPPLRGHPPPPDNPRTDNASPRATSSRATAGARADRSRRPAPRRPARARLVHTDPKRPPPPPPAGLAGARRAPARRCAAPPAARWRAAAGGRPPAARFPLSLPYPPLAFGGRRRRRQTNNKGARAHPNDAPACPQPATRAWKGPQAPMLGPGRAHLVQPTPCVIHQHPLAAPGRLPPRHARPQAAAVPFPPASGTLPPRGRARVAPRRVGPAGPLAARVADPTPLGPPCCTRALAPVMPGPSPPPPNTILHRA
jgi:hypothetical protein